MRQPFPRFSFATAVLLHDTGWHHYGPHGEALSLFALLPTGASPACLFNDEHHKRYQRWSPFSPGARKCC